MFICQIYVDYRSPVRSPVSFIVPRQLVPMGSAFLFMKNLDIMIINLYVIK